MSIQCAARAASGGTLFQTAEGWGQILMAVRNGVSERFTRLNPLGSVGSQGHTDTSGLSKRGHFSEDRALDWPIQSRVSDAGSSHDVLRFNALRSS